MILPGGPHGGAPSASRDWPEGRRQLAPVVEQLAAEFSGRMRVAKLNVDENPVTAARFRIRSIPALLMFNGGREMDRIIRPPDLGGCDLSRLDKPGGVRCLGKWFSWR
ncbi:hypothetical protein SBA6_370001 [Candidatus Sulfopaludibacter sp. SbA6]|nr:hypothetical protein SBA6_370001 [Candidatus Sulfopaludibacter sp. SbA6]